MCRNMWKYCRSGAFHEQHYASSHILFLSFLFYFILYIPKLHGSSGIMMLRMMIRGIRRIDGAAHISVVAADIVEFQGWWSWRPHYISMGRKLVTVLTYCHHRFHPPNLVRRLRKTQRCIHSLVSPPFCFSVWLCPLHCGYFVGSGPEVAATQSVQSPMQICSSLALKRREHSEVDAVWFIDSTVFYWFVKNNIKRV